MHRDDDDDEDDLLDRLDDRFDDVEAHGTRLGDAIVVDYRNETLAALSAELDRRDLSDGIEATLGELLETTVAANEGVADAIIDAESDSLSENHAAVEESMAEFTAVLDAAADANEISADGKLHAMADDVGTAHDDPMAVHRKIETATFLERYADRLDELRSEIAPLLLELEDRGYSLTLDEEDDEIVLRVNPAGPGLVIMGTFGILVNTSPFWIPQMAGRIAYGVQVSSQFFKQYVFGELRRQQMMRDALAEYYKEELKDETKEQAKEELEELLLEYYEDHEEAREELGQTFDELVAELDPDFELVTITVRVTDADGSPWTAGANVHVDRNDRTIATEWTDDDGVVEFSLLDDELYSFAVRTAADYPDTGAPVHRWADGDTEVTIMLFEEEEPPEEETTEDDDDPDDDDDDPGDPDDDDDDDDPDDDDDDPGDPDDDDDDDDPDDEDDDDDDNNDEPANLVIDEMEYINEGEPNRERVIFRNAGGQPLDLTGWRVEGSDPTEAICVPQPYDFPEDTVLQPGDTYEMRTDWIWLRHAGEEIIVRNADNEIVLSEPIRPSEEPTLIGIARVVDENGNPVEGEPITIENEGYGDPTVEEETTDSNGEVVVLSQESPCDVVVSREVTVRDQTKELSLVYGTETVEFTVEDDDGRDPARFVVNIIDAPSQVDRGEDVELTSEIENVGDETARTPIYVRNVDAGTSSDGISLELSGGESRTVTLFGNASEVGEYEFSVDQHPSVDDPDAPAVDGDSVEVTIEDPSEQNDDDEDGDGGEDDNPDNDEPADPNNEDEEESDDEGEEEPPEDDDPDGSDDEENGEEDDETEEEENNPDDEDDNEEEPPDDDPDEEGEDEEEDSDEDDDEENEAEDDEGNDEDGEENDGEPEDDNERNEEDG